MNTWKCIWERECARDQSLAAGDMRDMQRALAAGQWREAVRLQRRSAGMYAQARAGYELATESA